MDDDRHFVHAVDDIEMTSTLGIDLASQARRTAICAIDWDRCAVRVLARGHVEGNELDDTFLSVAIRRGPTKTAIDAPFGWPAPFMDALAQLRRGEPWPGGLDEPRAPFERRETDRWVHRFTGKLPLSVTTDRIAYCAMRCAAIVSELGPRDGSGPVVEAYPAAALRLWLGDAGPPSYKGASGHARREQHVAALLDELPLDVSGEQRAAMVDSDDCLDAFVCALVARAAELGETIPPETPEHRQLALAEGWIHLPRDGSLSRLVPVAAPARTRRRPAKKES
jgi:predicted nuclease with RNAse H fold